MSMKKFAALSKAAPRKAPVKRAAVSADVPEIITVR